MPDTTFAPKTASSKLIQRWPGRVPREVFAVYGGATLLVLAAWLSGVGPWVQAEWHALLNVDASRSGALSMSLLTPTVAWSASLAVAVLWALWQVARVSISPRQQTLVSAVGVLVILGVSAVGNIFSAAEVHPLWPALALVGGVAGLAVLKTSVRWEARRQQTRRARMETMLGDAKASYLNELTSELRVSVNAVLGMAELVTEEVTDGKRNLELGALRRAAESLQRTLRDVDELALAHNQQLQLQVTELPLLPLIHEQVNQIRREAEHKGLQIQLAVAVDTPRQVMGDAKRLGQVIAHMLNHSVRATRQGQIQLEIRRHPRDKRSLRIVVTDTSMSPISGKLASMTAPFSEAILEKARHGTGVGLSLAKKLAELMGGKLVVRHSAGRGSVMILTADLPSADGMSDIQKKEVKTSPQLQKTTSSGDSRLAVGPLRLNLAGNGTKSVLLVEDNPSTSALLNSMLDKASFRVVTCTHGREALQALSIAPYDIVLMDLHMPELDGMDTIKEIRRLEAERRLRRTPVIALGDAPFDLERQRCLDAGFDQHLCKPVRKSKLLESMATLMCPVHVPETTGVPAPAAPTLHQAHRDALSLLSEGQVIDAASAVEGLGGNASIYLDAIEQLAPALYNWPARFRDTLVRGDIEKARQMALDMQSILDVVRAVPCAASLGHMAEVLSAQPLDESRQSQALTQLDMQMQALLNAMRQAVERLRKGRTEHTSASRRHNSEI